LHAQLLGREYYQTATTEPVLVYAPLLVHASSAFLKRLFAPRAPRPLTGALAVTGYAVLLFLLPVHVATHRLFPADVAPPIAALSPAELDYEFVKAGLATWPMRSWALYATLVLGVALHAAEGVHVMWSVWAPGAEGRWKALRRRTRRVLAGVSVLPVLSGLYVLSREPLLAFVSMAERYRAAFVHSIVYRI